MLLEWLSSASGLLSYWQSRLSFGRVNGRSHLSSFHQRARSCSARPAQQRRPQICCWRVSQVHLDCRRIGNPDAVLARSTAVPIQLLFTSVLAAALQGLQSKIDRKKVAGVSLKCIWIAVVLAIQTEFWQGQRQIPSSFFSPTCSQLLCEAGSAKTTPELLLARLSSASGLPSYWQSSLSFGKVTGSSHPASFHQRARSCSARLAEQD